MKSKILLFLYLIVAAVPYFGAADKVDSQILYLNILNCLNIFLFIKNNKGKILNQIKKSISNIPVVFMGLFFIWSFITIIPASNKVESLISLSEIFTLLISLFFLIYHLSSLETKERNRFVLTIIVTITSVELITIIIPYLVEIYFVGKAEFQSLSYRGISGNVNVMSYSLLIKYPFIIYFLYSQKINKYIGYLLLILLTYSILSILQTRSAFISLLLITIILTIVFFIKENFKKINKIFFKILFPLFFSFFLSYIQSNYIADQNIQDRLETLLNVEEDQSINQRFRYYSSAFKSIIENPIFGIGVGNWEIESLKDERKYQRNYTVPYHAHNDYLEISAESGILAAFLYFGPLLFIIFLVAKKFVKEKINTNDDLYSIVIVCSIIVYLLDSMFNFPQARVMSQMNLIFLLAISTFLVNLKFRISLKVIYIVSLILFPLSLLSIYSSLRVFDSSKDQIILLKQFNNGDFSQPPLEYIEKIEDTYPNITATALPISAHKALHFLNNDRIERAIELLEESLGMNPHLYLSESFLGYAYDAIGEEEKGLNLTKIAFENAPNDVIHFANYLNSLFKLNDTLIIKNTYLSIPKEFKTPKHDEIYLLVMASLKDPSSSSFSLSGLDIDYQAGNDKLKKGFYMAKVGQEKTYEANKNYAIAVAYFEEENYIEAIKYFLLAAELNPYELVYLENAANSYMKIGKDKEALELLNKLINEYDAKTPKIFYLRGLLYYDSDERVKGCEDLKIALDAGLIANPLYSRFCL